MTRLILHTLALVTMALAIVPNGARAQADVVLIADMAVDGQGNVLPSPVIVVRGNTIASVSSGGDIPGDAEVVDLTGYTILPGLIDGHVHITANFEPGAHRPKLALYGARNAESALMSGFTTVRSLGGSDFAAVDLRDAIEEGLVPGPRLQVSSEWARDDILAGAEGPRVAAGERPAGEREIRTWVRGKAAAGVDWIKVLATRSSRVGGVPLYSQEQLDWFMDEARRQGKPVSAHAHAAEGVRRAVLSGARTIEHGALMDEAAMDLMIENGTYYSPNLYLGEYYIAHAEQMGYTGAAIEFTRDFLPPRTAVFTKAVEKGVKIVFGTDANRGWLWEGNTAMEFQRRNVAGQSERDAIISATTLAAEVLMVDDRGDLREGLLADVIAVQGNPLNDMKALMNVVFVMKDGKIYRRPQAEARPRT
jgi:imidazolonepropionase-like amidohydrolase